MPQDYLKGIEDMKNMQEKMKTHRKDTIKKECEMYVKECNMSCSMEEEEDEEYA